MEQKKEIDLTGFLLRAISMTDKALVDAKVAILDVEDPNTYDVAINKIAYATGLIDSSRELINFIQDEGLEKIMLNINQNWYSRLAFLEELLEEQKPICTVCATPNGKIEIPDSYKFISDVRVFKKSDVDDISFSFKDISQPDVKDEVKPETFAKEVASSVEQFQKKLKKKGKKYGPR